ncbi:MAG: nickel/cobalt transporter [Rhodoblastus sp.]
MKAGRIVAILALLVVAAPAFAQRNPFAVGASEPAGVASNSVVVWILAQQAHFYRALSAAARAARDGPSGYWLLVGLSFAYGVFHAAGPGHGKAVMASYMIANEQALKRGLALTFFAAVLQGLVAVAIVGLAALVFNATSASMKQAAELIEYASYAAIVGLGLYLVWKKGGAFFRALWAGGRENALAQADGAAMGGVAASGLSMGGATMGRATIGGMAMNRAPSSSRFACDSIKPGHVHTADCGHFHAPDPAVLGNGFSWGTAMATVFAAGARPCSGAILVLVFTLAQGVFGAGVAAVAAMSLGTAVTTGALAAIAVLAKGLALKLSGGGEGRGAILLRGAEFVAALVVLVVGCALLGGAWVSSGGA